MDFSISGRLHISSTRFIRIACASFSALLFSSQAIGTNATNDSYREKLLIEIRSTLSDKNKELAEQLVDIRIEEERKQGKVTLFQEVPTQKISPSFKQIEHNEIQFQNKSKKIFEEKNNKTVEESVKPLTKQTSDFSGLSIGVNIELKSTTLKTSYSDVELSGVGNQNIIGSAIVDYGVEIGKDSILLIGAKYDLQKTTVASMTSSDTTTKLEEQGHYSLYVAPGLLLNDKTLGYAKLSYENAKLDLNESSSIGAQSLKGIGFGLGIRTHLSGNWYANVEVARIVYKGKDVSSSTLTTGTTVGVAGLSYKF